MTLGICFWHASSDTTLGYRAFHDVNGDGLSVASVMPNPTMVPGMETLQWDKKNTSPQTLNSRNKSKIFGTKILLYSNNYLLGKLGE